MARSRGLGDVYKRQVLTLTNGKGAVTTYTLSGGITITQAGAGSLRGVNADNDSRVKA
jgi:hypothetical protein